MVRAIYEDSLEVLTILIYHAKQLQTTSQYVNPSGIHLVSDFN